MTSSTKTNIITEAESFFLYGGTSWEYGYSRFQDPDNNGFTEIECSGLVSKALELAGYNIPMHNAAWYASDNTGNGFKEFIRV